MNIHISNLSTHLQDEDLKNIFSPYGEVASAEIAMDAFTDRSRGFGYVEMPNSEQALAAITALNKTEVGGTVVGVQEAPPRQTHKGSYKVGTGPVNLFRYKKK